MIILKYLMRSKMNRQLTIWKPWYITYSQIAKS